MVHKEDNMPPVDFDRSVEVGDYCFRLARIAGRVYARRRLLNGVDIDPAQPEETIGPNDLPYNLEMDFHTLSRGDVPAVA